MSATSSVVQDNTLATLHRLNARFIHNFITNDVAGHDAILHRDFVYMSTRGGRQGRDEYLRRWATGFDPAVIVYWDTRDEMITVAGDTALVRATNKHTVRHDGHETTGMTTYTDTYVREDGQWKCIQAQLTTVTPDQFPPDSTIVSVYINGQLQR